MKSLKFQAHSIKKKNHVVIFEMKNLTVTRSKDMKLKRQRCNTIAFKSYFNVGIVEHLNILQDTWVNLNTIDGAQKRIR